MKRAAVTAAEPAGDADIPLPLPHPTRRVQRTAYQHGFPSDDFRVIPEETAVALVYDGSTQAVMMATPESLQDFAVGFSLTEGIVAAAEEIQSLEVLSVADGIEVRMWLAKGRSEALSARRRHMAGPTGCGLCGVDSLAEAVRPARIVEDELRVDADALMEVMDSMTAGQVLHRITHAVHGAALWTTGKNKRRPLLREDVGRHNALDKLVGAAALAGRTGEGGVLLLTSRVSVEMVQKAAVLGAPIMLAVSAPTSLAVRTAEAAGITLAAVARRDGFEVFTHPRRILPGRGPVPPRQLPG